MINELLRASIDKLMNLLSTKVTHSGLHLMYLFLFTTNCCTCFFFDYYINKPTSTNILVAERFSTTKSNQGQLGNYTEC